MTSRQASSWQGVRVSDLRSRWEREEVYVFESVTSTNDVARELADNKALSGSIVICQEQVEGRGRDGREWASPAHAGVYLSMLFRPKGECVEPLVTVLAGVDVATALTAEFPGLAPSIKWPNDLMVDERKQVLRSGIAILGGGPVPTHGIAVTGRRIDICKCGRNEAQGDDERQQASHQANC